MSNIKRRSALDRRLDKIRALEESGRLATKLTNRTLRKIMANKLAVLGAVLFVVICVMCFAAPLFTRYQPTAISLKERIAAPSAGHIFGTDQMGRDIWSRMLYGGRISINGRPAKAGSEVKEGDEITIVFGTKEVTVRVKEVRDSVRKEDADSMYEVIG